MRRITPKFGRLSNVAAVASLDVHPPEDIATMVRKIIKEELHHFTSGSHGQAHLGCGRRVADPVGYQCALQESFENNPTRWERQDYTNDYCDDRLCAATSRPTSGHSYYTDEMPRPDIRQPSHYSPETYRQPFHFETSRRPPGSRFRQQSRATYDSDGYREPPTCFNCGLRGHISRFCQRRQQQFPRFRPRAATEWRNNNMAYASAHSLQPPSQPMAPRNHSPVSDRSLTPPPGRQARSPSPRRRLSPPPLGN